MDMWREAIVSKNASPLIDRAISLKCPHCDTVSSVTAISIPAFDQMRRYAPKEVIVGYRCNACGDPIALRFAVNADYGNHRILLSEKFKELERPMETFEFHHLPDSVADDFREALTCYSHQCFNGAAAMCRRTIQSVATCLGASGTDKVSKQLTEAKELGELDEESYLELREVMLGGHDGSHPHLPNVGKERAALLVEIMKDTLTQLFVRKKKMEAVRELRKQAINEKRP